MSTINVGVRVFSSETKCTFAFSARKACADSACKKRRSRSSPVGIASIKLILTTRPIRTITACGICSAPSASRFSQFRSSTSARKWCTISTVSFANGMPTSSTTRPKILTICSPRSSFTKVSILRVRSSTLSHALSRSLSSTLTRPWSFSRMRCEWSEIEKRVYSSEKRPKIRASLPRMTSKDNSLRS